MVCGLEKVLSDLQQTDTNTSVEKSEVFRLRFSVSVNRWHSPTSDQKGMLLIVVGIYCYNEGKCNKYELTNAVPLVAMY